MWSWLREYTRNVVVVEGENSRNVVVVVKGKNNRNVVVVVVVVVKGIQ